MKRKRLKHFSDAIIGILTGYQVKSNFDHIKKNGQGEYVLDLLTGGLAFNGQDTALFPLFANIKKWFNTEITKNKIDTSFITVAKLSFEVGPISVQQFRTEERSLFFFKKVFTNDVYDCKTVINLILKTNEEDYSKRTEAAINF